MCRNKKMAFLASEGISGVGSNYPESQACAAIYDGPDSWTSCGIEVPGTQTTNPTRSACGGDSPKQIKERQ